MKKRTHTLLKTGSLAMALILAVTLIPAGSPFRAWAEEAGGTQAAETGTGDGTGTSTSTGTTAGTGAGTVTTPISVAVPPEESAVVTIAGNPLTIHDATGQRIVDKRETNLGDLIADAYRTVLGADVALVESGDIRASLNVGPVTYGDLLQVLPYQKELAVVKLSGADLMDALEMSASRYPDNYSSFFQVSGLTYDIQETVIPSVTTDSLGNFTGVSNDYRVTNIMINGKELDLYETYTVAGTKELLEGRTGFTMFSYGTLGTTTVTDTVALLTYLNLQLDGQVGSAYIQPQGRLDSIRLIRQSEVDRLIDGLVAGETVDFQKQLDTVQKDLLQTKDALTQTQEALIVTGGTIKASSATGKSGSSRYVRISWTPDEALAALDGVKYEVYKSSAGWSKGFKKAFTSSTLGYKNTSGVKKGGTYYYKVRACKTIGGKTYYSHWSNIAYRKITK